MKIITFYAESFLVHCPEGSLPWCSFVITPTPSLVLGRHHDNFNLIFEINLDPGPKLLLHTFSQLPFG